MSDNKAWSGKTGGTHWMQETLIRMFRFINPALVYPIMYVWVIGYIIGVPTTRRGIWYYWHHRRGRSVWSSIWHSFGSYVEFGKAILDRFAAWAGRRVRTTIEGQDDLNAVLAHNTGFIVISSHVGNQELAGYNFPMPKPMYALVYMGDTETVNQRRTALFEDMGIHTIPYQHDGGHMIDMHNALADGNILSIHGDRMLNDVKTIRASILGQETDFPEGAFRIAVTEKVPVLSLFMMREGNERYRLCFRRLSDGHYTSASRKEQENELLTSYVNALEEMANRYPHQWFHFYDFWK